MTTKSRRPHPASYAVVGLGAYAVGEGLSISAGWTLAALFMFFPALSVLSYLVAGGKVLSRRMPEIVQPDPKPAIEPYTFDLATPLKAPEPGPDQCPVCAVEDLPYWRDRRQTVPYGSFDAHWTCAAWRPYVAPVVKTTKVNDVIQFEMDGHRTYGYTEQGAKVQERAVQLGRQSMTEARAALTLSSVMVDSAAQRIVPATERARLMKTIIGLERAGGVPEHINMLYRELEAGPDWAMVLDTDSKIGVYDEIMRRSAPEACGFIFSYAKAYKLTYHQRVGHPEYNYARDFESVFSLLKRALAEQCKAPFRTTVQDASRKYTALEGLINEIYG